MEIRNIKFSYGDESFINNLSGTIEKGKITTILGPNGSGKSTLLNLLIHQLKPEQGQILIDDKNIRNMKVKDIAKKMAMIHQQNAVPSDISVERLVHFGRMPYQTMLTSRDKDEDEVVEWALKVTNLEKMKTKRVGALSGGERQRAWIAMALAQKTEILFLDEPTTYLDIFYQMEVLTLVKKLNREYGMTIVMVLHDINQAMQFSDNLIIMSKGEICYNGPVEGGITEKRLRDVYGIEAQIQWSEHNKCPYMIPLVSPCPAGI